MQLAPLRPFACVLFALAPFGCSQSAVLAPGVDAAVPQPDLASPPPPLDGGLCTSHAHKVVVPITRITLVDPVTTQGVTVRLLVTYSVRGCDAPADISVDVMPGNATDFCTITAHVFRSDQALPSCSTSRLIDRVVLLPTSPSNNFIVATADDAGHDGPRIMLRPSAPGARCTMDVPLGGKCLLDCQCMPQSGNATCLGLDANGEGVCGVSCSGDGDCKLATATSCDAGGTRGPARSCQVPAADCSCEPSRCLPRQACGRSGQAGTAACLCGPTGTTIFGGPCACDGECGPSGICTGGHCVTPCTSVGDCPPEGLYCDGTCQYGI